MITENYKDTLIRCIRMIYPVSKELLEPIVDYSINKRYKEEPAQIIDSYRNKTFNINLLALSEYIQSKEPICTAYGTMFKKHAKVPNPLGVVVQQFLDTIAKDKKMMFTFPKGSEQFEHYNLLQVLDKIDANGIYGALGMYTSLIYNVNVASSITSQGRASVSTMALLFESFLSDNVKFGSLDEVMVFMDHICQEHGSRKYNDYDIIDHPIARANCFAKLIHDCGWKWLPNDDEMEIIWQAVNNLSDEDCNRVYYKNNLYEFCSNSKIKNMITNILVSMKHPYLSPTDCPEEIKDSMESFKNIVKEYVYYGYMYPDRIDRNVNMIKNIVMISDTDSTIISLDAWFHFVNDITKNIPMDIKHMKDMEVSDTIDADLSKVDPGTNETVSLDFDFENDKIIEMKHAVSPTKIFAEDDLRFSIINMLAYILDDIVNDYMIRYVEATHATNPAIRCKMIAKNEFLFRRILMTGVKKNYASMVDIQEGHIIPESEKLDIKGIEAMAKSTSPDSTKEALKKIVLEDIMNAPTVDQFKIIKDIAILSKQIEQNICSGSKEYYKPAHIKSISAYTDPMRISGITASVVWNSIKSDDDPLINLNERNIITIAEVNIDNKSIEKIKDKFPNTYEKCKALLASEQFAKKKKIERIAIPDDVQSAPKWLFDLIDVNAIINKNLTGFVFESVGIQRLGKKAVNYTNMVRLD